MSYHLSDTRHKHIPSCLAACAVGESTTESFFISRLLGLHFAIITQGRDGIRSTRTTGCASKIMRKDSAMPARLGNWSGLSEEATISSYSPRPTTPIRAVCMRLYARRAFISGGPHVSYCQPKDTLCCRDPPAACPDAPLCCQDPPNACRETTLSLLRLSKRLHRDIFVTETLASLLKRHSRAAETLQSLAERLFRTAETLQTLTERHIRVAVSVIVPNKTAAWCVLEIFHESLYE